MRVLHTIRTINPASGGPIEGVKNTAARLVAGGHSVEIASLDNPTAEYVGRSPLPTHALGPSCLNYSYSSRFYPWLKRHANDYDAIVVNGLWAYHGLATWLVARRTGTPYVVYTHGMLDPWFKRQYPLKHLKKWMYWPWAEYRVLRDAQAVLFTSDEERLSARESFWFYQTNERVARYGTAGPLGDAFAEREAFYRSFPELANKRILLFLGRIDPKKGCDLAIQAFAQVLARTPPWHLVLAGPKEGAWPSQLVASTELLGIGDRVTWTGMLEGDLKWGAIHSADALLLPSHQENFGVVVAESLACGVPVLISNKVNIWREIVDDGAGIVAEDDLEGTISLLRKWAETDESAKNLMRSRSRGCFEERFHIRHASEDLISILTSAGNTAARGHALNAMGDSGQS